MAGLRRSMRGFPAILIILLGATIARAQGGGELRCEPGFVAADGSWILPVAARGGIGGPDDVTVTADDRTLPVTGVVTYALDGGAGLVAVEVLFDPLPPGDDDGLEAAIADALKARLGGPGVLAGVGRCTPDGADASRPGDAGAKAWTPATTAPEAGGTRLWDGLLAALTAASGGDLPDRRVVILVSDGREEIASRHVSASCIEGALRARIPVYVLSLARGAHREGDEARLREVAAATGGRCTAVDPRADPAARDAAVADLVAGVAAVRGLRLAPDGAALPLDLTVRRAAGGGTGVAGSLALRRSLAPAGRGRWLVVAAGLLVMAGAGLVLWRQRNVTVGELVVATARGDRRFPIPRHGATIGSDAENALVLPARTVSRHHAVIRVQRGEVAITDLRSAHGTTVNGQPVGTRVLRDGDRIQVGRDVALVYRGARRGRGGE